jgi:hypothetical protein
MENNSKFQTLGSSASSLFLLVAKLSRLSLFTDVPTHSHSNPWEIPRLDTSVQVKFYGRAERSADGKSGKWTGGLDVLAIPFDLPIVRLFLFFYNYDRKAEFLF